MMNNMWENMSTDEDEWNCNSTSNTCELDGITELTPPMDLSMINVCNSPDKSNEMSFYDTTPLSSPRPCSISPCRDITLLSNDNSPSNFTITSSNNIERRAFHEVDFNKIDSGYGVNSDNRKNFKFTEPSGAAPKRMDSDSPKAIRITPRKSGSCFRPFDSMGNSMDSNDDDDCIELLDMELIEDRETLPPVNLDSVISGEMTMERTPLRRGLSLDERRMKYGSGDETLVEKKSPFALRGSKRTEKSIVSPIFSKRWKSETEGKENKKQVRHVLQKSVSMYDSSLTIMDALAKDDSGLIGDFSKSCCLPLITGNPKNCDLKSISADTLANLLNGVYEKTVDSYRIIDCRYPYEYQGGHIKGAENIYKHDDIMRVFLQKKTETANVVAEEPKRNIIIFHCEFSSERGPKLSRFLRSKDREVNNNTYPALHYPEVYLLHEGYKEFFKSYSDLCDPKAYLPMDSDTEACRHFRATTKSWNGDRTVGPSRLGKSRSRLVL